MRPIHIVYCFITAFSLLLTGCASTGQNTGKQILPQMMNASDLYTSGKEAMARGDEQQAIAHFNKLVTQYPDDKFALQGYLELAYAYHKTGQTSATIATTERFIKNHPEHKNSDYAYYLRGLAAYQVAISQLGEESLPAATPVPYEAQMALKFLDESNQRFPEGKYSEDTTQRINTLNERIAQHLLFAAKQELDQNNPTKAALLAKTVMDDYPGSSAIQQAAIITNQAYRVLGLVGNDQARPANTAPVLESPGLPTTPTTAAATVTTTTTTATNRAPANGNLMEASDKIRDATWILSQTADHYTIQVLGTENEARLLQQIEQDRLQNDVAYYKKSHDGTTWYSLIYGRYANRSAAETGAQALPVSLRKNMPWIRKIGDIQASLSE